MSWNSSNWFASQWFDANWSSNGHHVGSAFPTQYPWFKIYHAGTNKALSVVASADAPSGMGGAWRIRKGGTTYAVYLVETSDPDASPIRIKTSTGVKAVRWKT